MFMIVNGLRNTTVGFIILIGDFSSEHFQIILIRCVPTHNFYTYYYYGTLTSTTSDGVCYLNNLLTPTEISPPHAVYHQ